MARVTVEDCLDNVDNRFQLVLVATKRARQLEGGKDAQIEWENDKPTVVALREIAEGLVGREVLNEVIEPRVAFDEDAELQAVLREEIANATGAGRAASAGSDAGADSVASADSDAEVSTASTDSDIKAGSDTTAESTAPSPEVADDAEEI